MTTTVEIGVYFNTTDAPYFRIGNATKGKLNNLSYRLAGPVFYDVTDHVQSVSVRRGKNRQFDKYSAGTVNVSFTNTDRLFDPLNTASVLYGSIVPRRQIRIRSYGFDIFNGYIEDWNFDYSVSGVSVASVSASDGFSLLAQQVLVSGVATVQQSGARVSAVLNQSTVAWPTDMRSIDTGYARLGADTFNGNALDYLNTVATSEQGDLFVAADGVLTFVEANQAFTSSDYSLYSSNSILNPSMEAVTGSPVTVRTNLVTNPSFETNTTGWFANSGSISISSITAFSGTNSCLFTANGGSSAGIYGASIPVTVGDYYTYSIYVKLGASSTTYRTTIIWRDASNTILSTSYGDDFTVSSSGFTRVSVIGVAPANATNAVITCYATSTLANGSVVYFDAALFEKSTFVGTYFDGSTTAAGDYTYAWSGTAHASTSSQRGIGIASWGSNFAAQISSTVDKYAGNQSVLTYFNNISGIVMYQNTRIAVTAGNKYTLTAYVKDINTNASFLTSILWYTAASGGTLVSTSYGIAKTINNSSWTLLTVTATVPATATHATPTIFVNSAPPEGSRAYIDAVLFENTTNLATPSTYFDGNTADTGNYAYIWTGSANASTSNKYVLNKTTLSDDGTGIPYVDVAISYGSELLYNQAESTSIAGTAVANNTSSQASYGIVQTSNATLLSSTTALDNLSSYIVNTYGEPQYRFEKLTVALHSLNAADYSTILGLDMGSIIAVRFTPNNTGDPIIQYGKIIGIDHIIGIDTHNVSLSLDAASPYDLFILNDSIFGILDKSALAL